MIQVEILEKGFIKAKGRGRRSFYTKGENFEREDLLKSILDRYDRNYLIKNRYCFGNYEISKRICNGICTVGEECKGLIEKQDFFKSVDRRVKDALKK